MSVVCCKVFEDKIEIASDSISVRGWTQSRGENIRHSKLTKINSIVVGGAGWAEENTLMQIFCETHQPSSATVNNFILFLAEFADWKDKKTENRSVDNEYIFVFQGKAFVTSNYLVQEILEYSAVGAGMDFALASLYLGHSPEEAVAVCCELSVFCELPVVLISEKK